MKFSEMRYERPDGEALKKELAALAEKLDKAEDYGAARDAFLRIEELSADFSTLSTLVSIRHSIDTRDEFYDKENDYWNELLPELEEYIDLINKALLKSPFRGDFEKEFGSLIFTNAEIALKTFSPEIIPLLQQENQLTSEYDALVAKARVPFEGKEYTIAQMGPFKIDPDDARRLSAWKAEAGWYKENQPQLDRIYDDLVKVRTEMGRKLGYENYTQLGYWRMDRNCYGKKEVEAFRKAVVKYLVPVADGIYRKQAERLGVPSPMSFADAALEFRSGNPKPCGTAQDILAQGKKFYEELSPETKEFYDMMLDSELLDVLATEGKQAGGYSTELPAYHVPFIFANFNGTQGDVEVVTHEAGHAFACWMNRDRIPYEYHWPTMEACEVHSMSMEFFADPWAEGFFGKDTDKYLYSHLAGAVTFIPYGCLVDHFQHEVYEHPEMSPAERHAAWKKLLAVYMPWLRLDGDIPFYSEGEGWQRQLHIYDSPFYYIDYCLAQTVSLQFSAMISEDPRKAWDYYMAYTRQGGSETFVKLLENAGLASPFEEETLKGVCEAASKRLAGMEVKDA